ncbi:hypothetical protein MSAN_01241000 [Mycena sanguinolenta]|uniref:DUF6534 domain-containing protein n=1 Tax=Mycena sanguinolenta TaxID=230812 RepID=A0A8H6YG00_9AGAR|nr:hypothetical protein MSAN_01241000 [Mycena sanguinolenta]
MSTTLPRLDAITGAPLIGTWASSLLYMAELHQAIYYFRSFRKENWKLRSYVTAAFTIDTISAVADYACVYLPVPLYVISTACVAFLVQSFLAWLHWRFAKNIIIVCFLAILILAAFIAGFSTGLIIILFPAFTDRNKIRLCGTVWIVTQVSADLIIAGALVGELLKAKPLFKGQRRVNNMLNHLVLHTIRTGAATALIAVLSLTTFLIDDETNVSVGILYPLGRVYVLSMLINLNTRIRDSDPPQNWTTSNGQWGTVRVAHGTTYNFTTVQFYPSEPHRSNSETTKSSVLLSTFQSIPETQPSEIEMVAADTKQV